MTAPRVKTLASRRDLDALQAAYRREQREGTRRYAALGREIGTVCGVGHCTMSTLVGVLRGEPRWCPTHAPDEVAILRAMSGDHAVTLWPHERAEAVRRLARWHDDHSIADLLGIAPRSVFRIRVIHHIPPALAPTSPTREDLAS